MNWRLAREQFEPTDLREANLAQRKNLLSHAAPRDLEELVPILSERVAQAKAAYDRATDELADCLLAIQERQHG